jgi:hypothetical protein
MCRNMLTSTASDDCYHAPHRLNATVIEQHVLLAKVVLFVVKLDLRAIQLYSLFSGRLLALFQPSWF